MPTDKRHIKVLQDRLLSLYLMPCGRYLSLKALYWQLQEGVQNKLLLYADDSAILVSGKNIPTVENALSEDLMSVRQSIFNSRYIFPRD